MAINLTANFSENAALPLDDRFTFATTAARDLLAAGRRYEGMIVYCVDVATFYYLASDLVSWSTFGTAPDNFSYKKVPVGNTVTIPVNQEMIVYHDVTVEGTLINNGSLVVIDHL